MKGSRDLATPSGTPKSLSRAISRINSANSSCRLRQFSSWVHQLLRQLPIKRYPAMLRTINIHFSRHHAELSSSLRRPKLQRTSSLTTTKLAQHAHKVKSRPPHHRSTQTINTPSFPSFPIIRIIVQTPNNIALAEPPSPITTVPSPARRERGRMRATGRPKGADLTTNPPPSPQYPHNHNPSCPSAKIRVIRGSDNTP